MSKRMHGESRTRLYKRWLWMRKRCNDKNDPKNYRYGGRGITVCSEWENSYLAFKQWAMSHGYSDELTLDRIDNDKGYSPDNCRWVNSKIQNNNRSDNILITYMGKTQSLHAWTDELNLPYHAVWQRINRCGWSIEKAFTLKKYERGNKNEKRQETV